MNGSRAATLTLPGRTRTRSFRLGDVPVVPALMLGFFVAIAILANVLAPYDPEGGQLGMRFKPPMWQAGGSSEHVLGTDHLGRDELSRLLFGARVSLMVGFTAVIVAGVI